MIFTMLRLFVPLFSIFFLLSCNEENDSSNDNNEESPREDVEFAETEEWIEDDPDTSTFFPFIKERLSADPYDLLVSIKHQYEEVKTEEDVFILYNDFVSEGLDILNEAMMDDETYDYEIGPDEVWNKVTNDLPFYEADRFCSECEFEFVINAYPFYELAQKTPEKNDDAYFKVLGMINGDGTDEDFSYGIYVRAGNNYYFQTLSCDFCSSNHLGSGVFYDVLEITSVNQDSTNLFKDLIYEEERYTLNYLEAYCYSGSQDEAMGELERIATNIVMPDNHMQMLYDAIDFLDTNDELQFNDECDYDFF